MYLISCNIFILSRSSVPPSLTFLDEIQMHRVYVHELQRLVLREMSGSLNGIRSRHYYEKLSILAKQLVSAVHDLSLLRLIYRLSCEFRIFFDSYLL